MNSGSVDRIYTEEVNLKELENLGEFATYFKRISQSLLQQ